MFKKTSIAISCVGLLFSSAVFSETLNAVSEVRYYSASNVHSVNESVISNAQCQALLPSKWTKSTAALTHNKVTDIDFGTFKMTKMDSLVIQPGVYDASTKTTPAENSPVKNIRHGTMNFMLNGKSMTSPAVLTATFKKGTPLGPKMVFVLKSSYCTADIKTKNP